ncbi:hypothetical protein FACS1894219_11820 [Clostridia bacterium]|nr:hypothetical protein FACS1894219_11820 [Clostridia bacterium]
MKKFLSICLGLIIVLSIASCSTPINIPDINTQESVEPNNDIISAIGGANVPQKPKIDPADAPVGGNITECIHTQTYNDSFHTITGLITDYIEKKFGENAYEVWKAEAAEINQNTDNSDCQFSELSIYSLIKHFAIPREDFESLYTKTGDYYTINYNVDVLYSGNDALVDAYYTQERNEEEMYYPAKVDQIKWFLTTDFGSRDADNEYFEYVETLCPNHIAWITENTGATVRVIARRYWSIPQYVQDFNVPREVIQQIADYAAINEENYTIDVDRIYSDDPVLAEALASGADIDIIDAMVVIPRVTDTLN